MSRLNRTTNDPNKVRISPPDPIQEDPRLYPTASGAQPSPWEPSGTVDISLKVGHHVNMGNYEHLEVDAWVKQTVPANSDFERVGLELKAILTTVLNPTLVEAYETTDESKSYIRIWSIEKGE